MRNYTRLPFLKLAQKRITLAFLLCLSFSMMQAQVVINTEVTEPSPDVVQVDFIVQNFEGILGMQYTMKWNPEVWEFQEVFIGDLVNLSTASFGLDNTATEGVAVMSWLTNNLTPVSLADGSRIYSFIFNRISDAGTEIVFSSNPVLIEIIGADLTEIELASFTNEIVQQQQIRGQIFQDDNGNCSFDEGETPLLGWQVEIENNQRSRRIVANANGSFALSVDENNTYTVRVIPPLALWELCETSYEVTIGENPTDQPPILEFAAKTTRDCPFPTVDVSTPFLRRCFENVYTVRYENIGTTPALDAYIELKLDEDIDFNSASVESSDLGNNTFRFDLGDLAVSQNGMFKVFVTVNCDNAELGQTHCTEAIIFPISDCLKSPLWSEADLAIEARCIEDETLAFTVKNIGTGDMTDEQQFTIIEGMIMLYGSENERQFKLRSGEELLYELPANGRSYRLETPQVPNHPFDGELGITLEGCGEDENGEFERGIVTMFPQRARSSSQDIDCQENRGAYDPNDKQAFPKGYGEERWLKQNTDIEYLIRFQNTGTDTAFNVVILDTLSPLLDAASVKPLVASHGYKYEQLDKRILQFTFPNIMLPDSNINEPLSHGFIRFQVEQQEDLTDDLIIENSAAIYFDFNEPIITNTVRHRIGEAFIETLSSTPELHERRAASVTPNPFSDVALMEFEKDVPQNTHLHLYDVLGREVSRMPMRGDSHRIERAGLPNGIYFYKVQSGGISLYNGRLSVQSSK